jgi:hypothetical protein
MKLKLLLFLLFIICAGHLSAQSTAAEIETLLDTKAVTFAQAARFLLQASDTMTTSDTDAAFRYAQERGWLPKNALSDNKIRLDEVSLLVMRSFDLKGGILYSLTKHPQLAYRELEYYSIIQGRIEPAMNVSGEQLLFITGRALSVREGN